MKARHWLFFLILPLALRAEPQALTFDGRKVDTPPKLTWWPVPQYPRELFNTFNYVQGTVVIAVVLDERGNLTEARIMSSPHPAMVKSALTTVNQAKFTPGLMAGRPIACIYATSINFVIKYGPGRGSGFEPDLPRRPKIPLPEYPITSAPSLTYYCEPAYPHELLLEDVKGEAEVQWVVNEQGQFESGEVLSATRPEFGAALLAAVENWRFQPTVEGGYAYKSMVVFRQRFRPGGSFLSAAEERMLNLLKKGGKDLVELKALDHRPHPIYQVAPKYPVADEKQCIAGEAVVEFIISHTGQVVLPRIVSATRPEFGWAAVTAVGQWFYSIPTIKGHPVVVRVRMPLGFDPPKPAAPAPAGS